jgi:hypothetical protein
MPRPTSSRDLTGRTMYRTNFFGKLVLQVEERRVTGYAGRLAPGVERTPIVDTFWRDATNHDLIELDWRARNDAAAAAGQPPPPPPGRHFER